MHKFTEERELESVKGSVEIVTVRSGATAIRLQNKRSQIYSLYNKANLFDDGAPLHVDAMDKAESVAFEHDMLRMVLAINSWNLPKEAFVIELEDISLTRMNIELLREDVFAEINKIISEYWEKPDSPATPEEQEEEAKNDSELSISTSTQA